MDQAVEAHSAANGQRLSESDLARLEKLYAPDFGRVGSQSDEAER